MAKRIVAAIAALVVTGGVAAAPAAADPGGVPAAPGAQCPGGFDLVALNAVLAIADPAFVDAIRAEDRNRDNQLCLRLFTGRNPTIRANIPVLRQPGSDPVVTAAKGIAHPQETRMGTLVGLVWSRFIFAGRGTVRFARVLWCDKS